MPDSSNSISLPRDCNQIKDLPQIWSMPSTQFSITLVRDPAIKAAFSEIQAQKPSVIISYELLWILLVWIFRAWRLDKAGTGLLKIWTQAWVGFLALLGTLFLVPFLAWGDPYRILLSHVLKAFFRHFLE